MGPTLGIRVQTRAGPKPTLDKYAGEPDLWLTKGRLEPDPWLKYSPTLGCIVLSVIIRNFCPLIIHQKSNPMKKAMLAILITGLSCLSLSTIYAQQVISAAGSHVENDHGSLSWTLGEVAIETISSQDLILTQGFHQTKLTVTGINIVPGYVPDISAFPNPTNGLLNVKLGDLLLQGNWQYILYDKNGKKLLEDKITSDLSDVSLGSLPTATYFLKVFGGDKESKVFKIVKH